VTGILLVLACQFPAVVHRPRAADCFGKYVAVRVVDVRRVDLGDAATGNLSGGANGDGWVRSLSEQDCPSLK
jgi:hypothetical protein